MKKDWYTALNAARTSYLSTKKANKREAKIQNSLTGWENCTRNALIAAEELYFDEILTWLDSISPAHLDQYFDILKKKANGAANRLLTDILSGKNDLNNLSEWNVTVLECVIKRIIDDISLRMTLRTKIFDIIRRRPEILIKLDGNTLEILTREIDLYLEEKELQSLLDYFKKTEQIYNFSQKIKGRNYLSDLFNENKEEIKRHYHSMDKMMQLKQVIIKKWNELSDADLAKITDFKSAVALFKESSLSWKSDLKNFKAILKLMDGDEREYQNLRTLITENFNDDGFYFWAAAEMWYSILKKRLESEEDLKAIYDLKVIYDLTRSSPVSKHSKFQRKIIKKFLE